MTETSFIRRTPPSLSFNVFLGTYENQGPPTVPPSSRSRDENLDLPKLGSRQEWSTRWNLHDDFECRIDKGEGILKESTEREPNNLLVICLHIKKWIMLLFF